MNGESPLRNRTKFQQRVIAAFPQEPVPSIETLFQPGTWAGGCDGRVTAECFAGRKWGDIEQKEILNCCGMLSFLSNESFTYYTAACLFYAFFWKKREDGAWVMEFYLSPEPFGPYSEQELEERTLLFTQEQREIIRDYFSHRERRTAILNERVRKYLGHEAHPEHGTWVTRYWERYAATPANPVDEYRENNRHHMKRDEHNE